MRLVIVLVSVVGVLALGAGCGGDSDPPYVGDWILVGSPCTRNLEFGADGTTRAGALCQLTDGSTGAQVAVGTYAESGGVFAISARESTCSGEQKSVSLSWSVAGDVLTTRDANGVTSFQRGTIPGGTGQATLGCFAGDGTFTPSPLAPL